VRRQKKRKFVFTSGADVVGRKNCE